MIRRMVKKQIVATMSTKDRSPTSFELRLHKASASSDEFCCSCRVSRFFHKISFWDSYTALYMT